MKKSRKFRLTPTEVVASAAISLPDLACMLDLNIEVVRELHRVHAVVWPNRTRQVIEGDPEDRPSWEIYVLKAYILAMRIKWGLNWYWLRELGYPYGWIYPVRRHRCRRSGTIAAPFGAQKSKIPSVF